MSVQGGVVWDGAVVGSGEKAEKVALVGSLRNNE